MSNPSAPDFAIAGEQDIILSPAKKVKYIGLWPPWPGCPPNCFQQTDPGVITVHVCVQVIHCLIVNPHSPPVPWARHLYAIEGDEIQDEENIVATALFGEAVGYTPENSEKKYCDIAILPFSAHRNKKYELPAIVLKRHRTYVERVPVPLLYVSKAAAGKFGIFEYLEIR